MKLFRYFMIAIIVLVVIFIVEAALYIEKERVKGDIYRLREEIIVLKLENRHLNVAYARKTNVDNLYKWAIAHGFTEQWARFAGEDGK